MARKEDFTEQEWGTLQKGTTGAGLLVSLGDKGFFDSFKEAGALAGHLREAREKSGSELVRELAEVRGTGFGLGDSPSEVESEALDALRSAAEILRSKAPDEVAAYRSFVLDLADSVAQAAKGVGAGESEAIGKIREALQTPAA